jgi:hypothetical protein
MYEACFGDDTAHGVGCGAHVIEPGEDAGEEGLHVVNIAEQRPAGAKSG